MRRAIPFVLAGSLLLVAAPAEARVTLPPSSRFMGSSLEQWARTWVQWALGDASNPLFAAVEDGDCGELIDGVFYVAAPIALDVELECEVPVGVPLVISHAGFFTFAEADETDEELQESSDEAFETIVNTLTFDGADLPLITTSTGAFDVIAEAGSFYDVIVGLGTGPVRNAVTGNFTIIRPLAPGDYTIEGEVLFTNGEHYSVTYHVNVG